jgi:hypothetical protein
MVLCSYIKKERHEDDHNNNDLTRGLVSTWALAVEEDSVVHHVDDNSNDSTTQQ